MNEYITIDELNEKDVLKGSKQFKEDIKMSLINMAMNIGHFNVNISIEKDEDRRKEMIARRAISDQRIKEALEKRNNVLYNYYMHDYLR